MRQLVELTKQAEKFSEAGVEVIAVFREEKEGVTGLDKIRKKTKTPFTLCLDTPVDQTNAYSNGRMEFDSFVVDSSGKNAGKIDGNLRRRALADQLFAILDSLTEAPAEP